MTDRPKTYSYLTEHAQVRQALKQIEIPCRESGTGAPEMFASMETSTARIFQCDQTLAETLGYHKKALVGRLICELYHAGCQPKAIQTFGSFLETGEIHNAKLQLQRKDGSPIDVILNVSAVRDKNGKILHSRSVWRTVL